MIPTLSSVTAPRVVVMTTCCAISNDKVSIVATVAFPVTESNAREGMKYGNLIIRNMIIIEHVIQCQYNNSGVIWSEDILVATAINFSAFRGEVTQKKGLTKTQILPCFVRRCSQYQSFLTGNFIDLGGKVGCHLRPMPCMLGTE